MPETVAALIVRPEGAGVTLVGTTLAALQDLVGDQLAPVTSGDDWHAYVGANWRMKSVAPNLRAERLARALGWHHRNGYRGSALAGPVVFLGSTDGTETDVPPHVVAEAIRQAAGL